jgi:hypothetical protein
VPHRAQRQPGQRPLAGNLVAGIEIEIAQASWRGGQELVGPAIEGMQRGQRGLQADRAVAFQLLVTRPSASPEPVFTPGSISQ